MFKVECLGCKAPYQVDERRVPSGGLKMRCPKCGTSFKVEPPAGMQDDAAPASPEPRPPGPAPSRAHKATMMGVAPESLGIHRGVRLGAAQLAPAGPPQAVAPEGRAPQKASANLDVEDLPSVVASVKPRAAAEQTRDQVPGSASVVHDSAQPEDPDLPAVVPRGARSPARSTLQGVPSPGAARPGAGSAADQPGGAADPGLDQRPLPPAGNDLPVPVRARRLPAVPRPGPAAPTATIPQGTLDALVSSVTSGRAGAPSAAEEIALPALVDRSVKKDQQAGLVTSPLGSAEPAPTEQQPPPGDLSGDLPLPARAPPRPGPPRRTTSSARTAAYPALAAADPFDGELPLPIGDDLDLPLPAGEDAELPSVVAEPALPSMGGDADLPSLSEGMDLPSPGPEPALPSAVGDLPAIAAGLPSAAAGLPTLSAGLPSPAAGLPSPAAGLPSPAAGLPSPAAGLPSPAAGLPSPAAAGLPLPTTRAGRWGEAPTAPYDPAGPAAAFGLGLNDGFGELDLPGQNPSDLPDLDPLAGSLPPMPGGGPSGDAEGDLVRQTGGGVDYGEVNLRGDAEAAPLEADATPTTDDMEFADLPEEEPSRQASAARVEQVARPRVARHAEAPPRRRWGIKVLAVVLALGFVGGAALAFTEYGPFGWHAWDRLLRGNEYEELLTATISEARKQVQADTYPQAKAALKLAEQTREKASRVAAVAAYASYLGYMLELRFGEDPEVHARAQVLLSEQEGGEEVEHLELARAAQDATGQLARAKSSIAKLERRDPNNVDVLVLSGEVELLAKKPEASLRAWDKAERIEKSARTAFGLARALYAQQTLGKGAEQAEKIRPGKRKTPSLLERAETEAKQAIARNAAHVGARLLLARIAWVHRDDEASAMRYLNEVTDAKTSASPAEIVANQTLLGDIHLQRSRVSHAEQAYSEALRLDPKAAGALRGLGDALHRVGRYSEALARYEAASKADPQDLATQVGVAKTMIALERISAAKPMLEKLAASYPRDVDVAYWEGRVREATGDRPGASKAYERAIENGGNDPRIIDSYIALAEVLTGKGEDSSAQSLLDKARRTLERTPGVHKALGDLALRQGRYEAATAEFNAALSLDHADVDALFKLGVAQRQSRKFDEAAETFEKVARSDESYPNLALERGLLFEAAGQTEEALKAYEAALAKAPEDLDLMLRVGCGKVAAERAEDATVLLERVLEQRPRSAETNHCLGRALLLKGSDMTNALRRLKQAVDLAPNRADYHLYVGWAALEAGRMAEAADALKSALDLDKGLGDAYWQRGILRYRQGALRDAVQDLTHALELRPSRYEAHAALAEAYYDLGREAEALAEWRKAIDAEPDNARWRFRYGKLLAERRQSEAAIPQLRAALQLGEKMPSKPRWSWDAHLLVARALMPNPDAVAHWQAFLREAPLDSPYRSEAERALDVLGGKPPER